MVSSTPLEFVGDAISLSGLTGTKLKCDVIGAYYPFWWKITSGGKREDYQKMTSIVELNAATGEDYIKDTKETVLGSAGHALELKVNHLGDENIKTNNLKVFLVEEHQGCYEHLKKVIKRRWPSVPIREAEGPAALNSSNIYLLNNTLDDALNKIDTIQLGNAIYYFDPLRSVRWEAIERVATKRMGRGPPFQTGTEFLIFIFTSDWFLGREDFAPLPCNKTERSWTDEEKTAVSDADALFGNKDWRIFLLNEKPIETKEKILIALYKYRLYKWFRYVLLMPFNPKKNELFHLILCSNYEAGVTATRSFFTSKTFNLPYRPDNKVAFQNFVKLHPKTLYNLGRRKRPLEWLLLWKLIKTHESGVCDCHCRDFLEIEQNVRLIDLALNWLLDNKYLVPLNIENAWQIPINRYQLNWKTVSNNLGIDPPQDLKPLSPEEFAKVEMQKTKEFLGKWKQLI
jgi:three-Cys-motif partner protein